MRRDFLLVFLFFQTAPGLSQVQFSFHMNFVKLVGYEYACGNCTDKHDRRPKTKTTPGANIKDDNNNNLRSARPAPTQSKRRQQRQKFMSPGVFTVGWDACDENWLIIEMTQN